MPGATTAPSISTTSVDVAGTVAPRVTPLAPGVPVAAATARGLKGAALDSTATPPVGIVAQIAKPDAAQTIATIVPISQRGTRSSFGDGCGERWPSSSGSITRQSAAASTTHSLAGSAWRRVNNGRIFGCEVARRPPGALRAVARATTGLYGLRLISHLSGLVETFDAYDRSMRPSRLLAYLFVFMLIGCSITPAPQATPGQTNAVPTTASSAAVAPSVAPSATTVSSAPSASSPVMPSQSASTSTPAAASPSAGPTSTVPSVSPPSSSGRPAFASVDDAYNQSVAWRPCTVSGTRANCAIVYVPTDYDQPSAGTTALAVATFPSTGTPQGDLFINPGGPGAGGIGFASYLARNASGLSAHYNIVGFDPRGTGQSDPLVCLETQAFDTLNAFDPTPETSEERQQGIDLVEAQGEACDANSGPLAAHVSTIEAARDIDLMRALLGDDKLDYFGFSYGTFLGTTYAALFPERVDRFVLDGAVKPGLSTMDLAQGQTRGIQTELDTYIASCVATPSCPLGQDAD